MRQYWEKFIMPVLKRTKGDSSQYGTFIPTGEIVACGEMAKMSDDELRAIMKQPHAKVVRVVVQPKKKKEGQL